jgi:hypothetical protein
MSDSNTGAGALFAANRQSASITQAVFIDARVPDLAILLHGVAADAAVYVLAPDRDGVRQIADILAAEGLCDLNAVSIVAHGVPGALEIGDTRLDAGALRGYAQPLGQIGASLASDGSVLLYACDVGRGASGARFVADLSRLLDANIAAASHPVGASMLGGSFDLDVSIGAIGAAKPFAARSLAAFGGLLVGGQGGANGGAGGSDSPTGVGGGGGNSPGSGDLGAGGGGAGAIGGRGGQGFLAGGGAGGAFPGAAGANGANAGGTNGGGGGGGAHRFVGGALPVASATGGNGGNGGGGSGLFGNGGGGGAGGFGAVVAGGGALGTLGVAATGGAGGAGGNAGFFGGNGGTGGTGLLLNVAGATLIVDAAVTGGAGGAGGVANPQLSGSAAPGGVGLVGAGVSVTVGPAGSVTGGLSGNGGTRAAAIFFTGGTNTLTFNHAGTSGLTGNIAVIGSLDFAQGNGVDTTVSNVITFDGSVSKSGANKITLSGINGYTGATTVNGGTLALSGSGSIATSSKVDVANAAGTFDIAATTAGTTVTSLTGVASSHVTLGAQTLTLSNAIDTYAGIIQGTGGLALTAGTLR